MKNIKKIIGKLNIIFSNRGSFSIEALITLPVFLIVTIIFCLSIRAMFIYEMMDNCFSNVSENISHNMIYSQLVYRDGIAENIARISLVDYDLQNEINALSSMWAKRKDSNEGFEIIEEDIDNTVGVGVYSLNYKIDLIGNKKINCQHIKRIRSVWQYDSEEILPDDIDDENQIVYTSTRGRKFKIYHSDPSCLTLKRSYKKAGSVKFAKISDLSDYRECYICKKKRLSK